MVYTEKEKNELFEKIWTIDPADDKKGTWWWWFWLFFIENKENPDKPHQLMILWSTKNEKQVTCNDRVFEFPNKVNIQKNKSDFDGVVAVWYYDGEMHDGYLLEEAKISLTKKPYSLTSDSKNKTSFYEKDGKFKVIINKGKKKFDFDLSLEENNDIAKPTHSNNSFFGGLLSFSALGIPKADFTGTITDSKEEKIKGTAYFQYVIVNAPSPSWYWGIFHFKEGSILSYFNPHVGPALLKGTFTNNFIEQGNFSMGNDIYFFSQRTGKKEHFKIKSIKNNKNSIGQPVFSVKGENKNEKISFDVDCYSDAYWEFEKKSFGFLKSKLRYNEYPSKIKNFVLQDKKGNVLTSTKEIGEGVGNAEHSWGFLL
tara:strand:- start:5227 stop:6333 length:1107 start_codon:yes stop_codon:yes gene_type:complete